MTTPGRVLPKLAAKRQGEKGQVAAATERKTLLPRRRNVSVACQVHPQDEIGRTAFGADNRIPMDTRLHGVDISRWIIVAISNQFAAEAISLYLDEPALTNFCSRMLVNALLAWALYARYEPMAATLPAKFLDEALRIYDAEKGVDCLTTVAATSLMNYVLNLQLLKEVRDESHRSRDFFSTYPVDLEILSKDPSSATLEELTSRFQEQLSVVGQPEASKGVTLPDGWKGSVEDLITTLPMLKNN
ncbi:N-terminal fungal transcription regulatory domain-containing protein [Fusarium austroafricanum]|uniref:N-terminal fungal transcription regulatory domain-containing protein n=1 Tax=Fusarium austroafricanum TaxID=2364996 RepID=A0A8H4KT40_9HYPO|nr:N-terminal fungal transcription regulatory domain-containing protein [Fusarium austroafricanum]